MRALKTKGLFLAGVLAVAMSGSAQAESQQAAFATTEALVTALETAIRTQSADDIKSLFGADALSVMPTGETFEERLILQNFINAFDEEHFVQEIYGRYGVLFVGEDNWAFPMPMIRGEDGLWTFDVEEGLQEMIHRQIGRNELATIEVLQSYVAAQNEYKATDWDGDGVLEYASAVISDEGEKNGLYWPGGDSPAGELFARAAANGYIVDGEEQDPEPYEGYVYRMFSSQSDAAPGGAMEYVINGHKIAGHAAMAVPAEYGVTGVMSFMVSANGVILEKDLGEDGLDISLEMESFDPGDGWTPI